MTTLYRLRGLEWKKVYDGKYGQQFEAETPVGKFTYWTNPEMRTWSASLLAGSDESWLVEQLPSISAAQSAAEAHYRARMAEGLVEVKAMPIRFSHTAWDDGGRVITADGEPIGHVVDAREAPSIVQWVASAWADLFRANIRAAAKGEAVVVPLPDGTDVVVKVKKEP